MAKQQTLLTVLLIVAMQLSNLGWSATATAAPLPETNARIYYVKPDVHVPKDCSSWVNACNLQTALTDANAGDLIRAAGGIYYPNDDNPGNLSRGLTFQIKGGVALYGGFAGDETGREERDWNANPTILSGDIDRDGLLDDGNFYRVVSGAAISPAQTFPRQRSWTA